MSKSTPQTLDPQAKKAIKFTFMGRKFNTVEAIFGLCLMIPTVAFLAFTFVIPVVQVIQLSFTNFNMATGEMKQIGLSNYTYLLKNDRFWLSMWNTCKYSFLKLTLDTALALLIAVMLDQNIPLRSFLRSTYFAPVVVPMVASSLIWIWFYDPAVGPFIWGVVLQWVVVRDTVKRPTMCRAAPIMENYVAPNIHSAEAEKPWAKTIKTITNRSKT